MNATPRRPRLARTTIGPSVNASPLPPRFAGPTIGLVVVDHGSRRDESNRRHEEAVAAWRRHSGFPIVEPAHMEFAEPSVGSAFDACVAAGASTVVVAPYFLGPGRHWDRDVPALAADAAARHSGVRYLVSAPLGPHEVLMRLLELRVAHCLGRASGDLPECESCGGTSRCSLR